jgi:hypothetical protein
MAGHYHMEGSVLSVTQLMTNTGKPLLVQAWTFPYGFRRLTHPERLTNGHLKVARLLVLHTGRLYPQEIFLVFILLEAESTPVP